MLSIGALAEKDLGGFGRRGNMLCFFYRFQKAKALMREAMR